MQKPTNNECLLKKVEEQEIAAREFGFYWTHINQLIQQIQNECVEVQEAWHNNNRPHLQEELGDLLQAAVSLVIFCQFDPHETLSNAIAKFQTRYNTLVSLAQQDGRNSLQQEPFEVLMNYWNQSKNINKSLNQ